MARPRGARLARELGARAAGQLGPSDRRRSRPGSSPATGPAPKRTRIGRSSSARPRPQSPIGRYAGALALLALGRNEEARARRELAARRCDGFPEDVADALRMLAAGDDAIGYIDAVESVLESFEKREAYLEDVPVADTVIVLQALAGRRGLVAELESPLLPE